MKLRDFTVSTKFAFGQYEICILNNGTLLPLLSFYIAADDEDESRHVASITCPDSLDVKNKRVVLAAAIRAGARHPGICDEDLASLHREALRGGHIELFTDLNALTTGLLSHLVRSLGQAVARVIVSSSSIDVLHEYQSHFTSEARLGRAEMVRALRILDELHRKIPVHIHQLQPGDARYFTRAKSQPPGTGEIDNSNEHSLYISEDRQMVAAFWDYQNRSNPRVPVFLITSDFNLAHVCAAERAPFMFAQTPFEYWRDQTEPISLDTLWFDPFALVLRSCIPHAALWELSLVFGDIYVVRDNEVNVAEFSLSYNHRTQRPGRPEDIKVVRNVPIPIVSTNSALALKRTTTRSPALPPAKDRKIKLSLVPIIEVLPTRQGQRIPLQTFRARDEDSLRQLRQLGQLTELYQLESDDIIPGPSLAQLLSGLAKHDYKEINEIFIRHPTYKSVLEEAASSGRFPSSKVAGAATGWAVMLGAAYKTKSGVLYGLADVPPNKFEETVVRFHREIGDGQAAASLPRVLDRTCLALRLSPIRFETLLDGSLGHGALATFEVQRASIEIDIPPHPVLVFPTSALSESYIRTIEPGRGIIIKKTLVSSLVRRPGRT